MPVPLIEHGYFQSVDGASEGGALDTVRINSDMLNNLWPPIDEADRIAGGSMTRKSFFVNESGTETMALPKIWTGGVPFSYTERIGFGIDDADDDNPALNLTQLAANTVIQVVSSGSDTRTVTVVGLDAAGDPQVEVLTLNGSTPVNGADTFSVLYAAYLSVTSGTRTVTVRRVTPGVVTLGSLVPNEINAFAWIDAPTDETGALAFADLPPGDSIGLWHELTWGAVAELEEVVTSVLARETG